MNSVDTSWKNERKTQILFYPFIFPPPAQWTLYFLPALFVSALNFTSAFPERISKIFVVHR